MMILLCVCGFYCITFIEYMIGGKVLLDYTNLFSPNDYIKSDKIMHQYFIDKYRKKNVSLEFRLKK